MSSGSESSLTAGMWVKVGGFSRNQKWNGVTGYLLGQPDSATPVWNVNCPKLAGRGENAFDCVYQFEARSLTPLDFEPLKDNFKFEVGDWVHMITPDAKGKSRAAMIKGFMQQNGGLVYVVRTPALFGENFDSCFSVGRHYLRYVVPTGFRILRKTVIHPSKITFEWMGGSGAAISDFAAAHNSDASLADWPIWRDMALWRLGLKTKMREVMKETDIKRLSHYTGHYQQSKISHSLP